MRILIVDDEPLARRHLRALLGDCNDPAHPFTVDEAATASQALARLCGPGADLVLLDIQMPGTSGMTLAHTLRTLPAPPAVVFVTAHAAYATRAFDLDACDYLSKPVRLQRLQQALAKVRRQRHLPPTDPAPPLLTAAPLPASTPPRPPAPLPPAPLPVNIPAATSATLGPTLTLRDRGREECVPISHIAWCRAEQKYVTIRTPVRSYVVDHSLHELEHSYPGQLLRIHRNALVNPAHISALHRHHGPATTGAEDGDYWAIHLHSVPERLPVSRRQLPAVRAALAHRSGAPPHPDT